MKTEKISKQKSNDTGRNKQFVTEQELADRWGSSIQHVRKLRYSGLGPEVTWIGRSVRYKFHHIRMFERANTFKSRAAKDVAA